MDLSVIVPLYNEEESITELTKWIDDVMKKNNFSYEIIMVDDGSKDNSWNVIQKLADDNTNVHGIKLKRNYGKSAALHCGFQSAEGDVVITMDADLQDSPDEIPELYRMIKDEHYDLVSGWKQKRYDPISKTVPTKLFNAAARVASGIKLHDFNCGLKAYRKNVIKDIEVYGEMHRYIPVLAKQAGYTTIGEKVVIHRARKFGVSKFGINRFINGFLDLLSISFISRFSKKPMHFFGSLGTLLFLISLMAIVGIGVTKYFYLKSEHPAPLITSTPYFYIALTGMILGTQLFLAGFLAELISRSASNRNDYVIDKKI